MKTMMSLALMFFSFNAAASNYAVGGHVLDGNGIGVQGIAVEYWYYGTVRPQFTIITDSNGLFVADVTQYTHWTIKVNPQGGWTFTPSEVSVYAQTGGGSVGNFTGTYTPPPPSKKKHDTFGCSTQPGKPGYGWLLVLASVVFAMAGGRVSGCK